MSSLKEQVDMDVKRFFEQIDKQHHSDQLKTLKILLEKYAQDRKSVV